MSTEDLKQNMKQNIDDIFEKLEEHEAKKNQLNDEAKRQYQEKISALQTKKTELNQFYQQALTSTDDKMDEIKSAFNQANNHFKAGFNELKQLF